MDILLKGVTSIKSDCKNDKYYVAQEEKFGVFLLTNLLDNIQATPILADYYFGSGRQWLVENNVTYFVDQSVLYSMNLTTRTKPKKHMSNVNMAGFNVASSNIYFSEKVLNDSYIAQITAGGSKK